MHQTLLIAIAGMKGDGTDDCLERVHQGSQEDRDLPADRQALGGGKRLGDENTRSSFAVLSIFCDL